VAENRGCSIRKLSANRRQYLLRYQLSLSKERRYLAIVAARERDCQFEIGNGHEDLPAVASGEQCVHLAAPVGGRQALSVRIQQWPRIHSAAHRIVNPVVEMRRSVARVARISNVAKYVPGIDDVAGPEPAVPIQVRVVVHLSSRTEDVDDFASGRVGSDADDYAFRRAEYRCPALGKDVDALMRSSSTSRKTP